jgi:hypothetical protein
MSDTLNSLGVLSALILSISLAAERFVTIVKTLFPKLDIEKTTPAGETDLTADKPRRLTILALALTASYVTVGLVFNTFNPMARVTAGESSYYVWLIALLGSGGSAFWNGVVSYTKEAKEARSAEKTVARLSIDSLASDSSKVVPANVQGIGRIAPRRPLSR